MKYRGYRKLGRTSSHRRATLRSMLVALLRHGEIRTTLPRAKELIPLAQRLVSSARRKNPETMRRCAVWVPDRAILQKLFDEIAPRHKERNGGVLRLLRLGRRKGDAAPVALLRLG